MSSVVYIFNYLLIHIHINTSRWCEHGYNTAFTKTLRDLKDHFVGAPQGSEYSNVQEVSMCIYMGMGMYIECE